MNIDNEVFYRLFGVLADGGTITVGNQLTLHELTGRMEQILTDKRSPVTVLTVVPIMPRTEVRLRDGKKRKVIL